MPKAAFEKIAEKYPKIIEKMAGIIRRRLRRNLLVIALPRLFGQLDPEKIQDIESSVEWIRLNGGEVLFQKGDSGDSLYIVVSGRLRAIDRDEFCNERVLNEIAQGESLGEMAFVTGEPRTASVYAIRDSELVKLSKSAFERIANKYPQMMMALTKILIERLRKKEGSLPAVSTAMNLAVIPASPHIQLSEFANRLASGLSVYGPTLHLSSSRLNRLLRMHKIAQSSPDDPRSSRFKAWLDEQESRFGFIIYEADTSSSPWTGRCIRQADKILIVAEASARSERSEIETTFLNPEKHKTSASQILVLLHPDGSHLPSGTARWLSTRRVDSHYHLRWNTDGDFSRLARLLSGRAVGLALSGGGARGFAHIGVIRALLEANIPIDLIGGTSMGAIIAAQHAMGWDYETMLRVNREVFIDAKPLRDYTLPIFSLIKGRKFDRLAKKISGDTCIEDLWVNYFCISTNLSTSDMIIGQKGLIWKAIRASASLPGILAPVIDGSSLLVDGGILDNVPGDVMRSFSPGAVVVVNVSPKDDLKVDQKQMPSPWKILLNRILPFKKSVSVPSIFKILIRATVISSIQRLEAVESDADLYLTPPIEHYGLLEFESIDEIADVGYQYAKGKIKELLNNEKFRNFISDKIG